MSDYLDIVYDRKKKPVTSYPAQLVDYIIKQAGLTADDSHVLLEPGVGMGDHLRLFRDVGFKVRGLDISPKSKDASPDLDIDIMDADSTVWPYKDNQFDVIYSKSFIEHLVDPVSFLNESFRVLKPGGVIVTLTPDWVSGYKKFYDDYTHKTPFTVVSLRNIQLSVGFEDVQAYPFRQLPFTWTNPLLNMVCAAVAPFVPFRTQNKFFRWSRELMLMSHARKPGG